VTRFRIGSPVCWLGSLFQEAKLIPKTEISGEHLIVRADAGTEIGTGHVMRCLALAQAWQEAGGYVTFLLANEVGLLEERLESEGMEVAHLSVQPGDPNDARQTRDLARETGSTWVVVDGYHFSAEFQKVLKCSGLRLLCIDDNGHAGHYFADIVLNQNIHAHEDFYGIRQPYTRLLLGSRYVLLRQEFLRRRGLKRKIPEIARRLLITLGGGDPDNVTLKVVQAIKQVKVDGLEVSVVVGGSNPHHGKLKSAVQDPGIAIRLKSNVKNMPDLMAGTDLAVSSGGTTVWELAFMGVPSIIGMIAPNQEFLVGGLKKTGMFLHAGWFSQMSVDVLAGVIESFIRNREMRKHMSCLGQQIIDSNGCNRVLDAMKN